MKYSFEIYSDSNDLGVLHGKKYLIGHFSFAVVFRKMSCSLVHWRKIGYPITAKRKEPTYLAKLQRIKQESCNSVMTVMEFPIVSGEIL